MKVSGFFYVRNLIVNGLMQKISAEQNASNSQKITTFAKQFFK
jgi:hypothetical protein